MYALFAKIAGRWKYYGLVKYKQDAEDFKEWFNDDVVEAIKVVCLDEEDD